MKNLVKIKTKNIKRHGRGYGSGRGGHTSGRGTKGQKARSKVGILFEGVKVRKSTIKRLPLIRGKGKFKAKDKPVIVNLSYLNILPENSEVTIATLVKHGIVKEKEAKKFGVKILGDGELQKKLTIDLPLSKSALTKLEKAGGKVKSRDTKSK